MGIDTGVADRLVGFLGPIIYAWLFIGLFISVSYHISLYIFDGEFREGSQRALDVFISILRGLLYLLIWPYIFILDRSALYRIKMLLLYAVPKERADNWELQSYMQERRYRRWVTDHFMEQQRLERRRAEEQETGAERRQLMCEVHDGNPALGRTWLLTGVGTNQAGVSELVRLYPEYYLAEEIEAKARVEVELRRLHDCVNCGTRVPARAVKIPELRFLRVLEPESTDLVVEGWALEGRYEVEYENCPECGAVQPVLAGDVSEFGKTPDVIKAARLGMTYHWDLP